MVLFRAAIRRDSVSLLRLPPLSDVQVFLCEISFVCPLKCPYGCFSSYFFSSYFCSIDVCLVSVVSDSCNQSSTSHFYVVF